MVAFYNAKDQAIYNAGDKFISQSKYLQDDYTPTEGISYEGDGSPVSYANSMGGIMTQAPIIYPPINQGGGGGGGGDDDDDPKGPKGPKGPTMSPIDAAKQAGLFFLNPLGYLASKAFGAYRKHQQRKKADNITEQASGLTDRENITKIQDYTGKKLSNYRMSRPASERNFTGGGPQANDPIGGFENKSGMGRTGYFFGGRVNYKVGGRTDAGANRSTASKAGVGQINEAGNKVDGGNYNNNNDGGSTKPTFFGKNDNIITTTDFISKKPNLTINYTDPKNYASVFGKIGFDNILDNDDLTAAGNVTGEFGPIGYNTNFTDQGITGTNLTAGNFNANISPDMQVQNIGYNNNINGINYGVNTDFDNTMFTAGVNFKNGGLASIL